MKSFVLPLLVAVFVLAGCAGSKKATMDAAEGAMSTAEEAVEMANTVANSSHPLVGAWDYTLDTPQGVFNGILSIMETGDGLSGTIAQADQPDLKAPVEELMFDKENSRASFTFDSGEYGIMKVKLKLDGDALDGQMTVTSYGVDVPMTAKRMSAN